jgi:hypothetical protein
VKVFKTKWFVRYARQSNIQNKNLCEAIERAEQGLVEADLGGGVIKQRVARAGQGRSGGFRVIIAYRRYIGISLWLREKRKREYR